MFDSLKSTFKSAIPIAFYNLFSLKMKSSPFNIFLPDPNTPVEAYITTLKLVNLSIGSKELTKWKVASVTHLRTTKKLSKHEYMRASVRDPDGNIIYLAFKGSIGEHANVAGSGPELPQRISPASSLVSVSESISSTRLAQDVVSLLPTGKWDQSDEEVGTLTFTGELPTLYAVADLAAIIHIASQNSLLFSSNCYHYAGTIMQVLSRHYQSIPHTPDGANAGTWCRINLCSGHTDSITCIHEEFKKSIATFQTEPGVKVLKEDLEALKKDIEMVEKDIEVVKKDIEVVKKDNDKARKELADLESTVATAETN